MSSNDEKIAIVQRGVDAFAEAETALDTIVAAANKLEQVYRDGHAAGMLTGSAATKEIAIFNRVIGMAGDMKEVVYAAHQRGTAIAKANDADVAIPATYATLAGTDAVTVMSGGDR